MGFTEVDRDSMCADEDSEYSRMARLALYNSSDDSYFVLAPSLERDEYLPGRFTNFNNSGMCSMTLNSNTAKGLFVLTIPNKITPNCPTGDSAIDNCVLNAYSMITFNGQFINHPIESFEEN